MLTSGVFPITIDRTSSTNVIDQITSQLRYLIASGFLSLGDPLPSTRALAAQIGVSFHTIRKAYQQLESEGVVTSGGGMRYRIKERVPLSRSERLERGAALVQDSLRKLVGIGLETSDIEFVIAEQLELLQGGIEPRKVIFAASYGEMAEQGAQQLSRELQLSVEPVTVQHAQRHRDADFVVSPYALVRTLSEAVPGADVLGVHVHLSVAALDQAARLLPNETLGIITRDAASIPPLMTEVKAATGYSGPIIASTLEERPENLEALLDDTALLLYTPSCGRRVRALVGPEDRHELVEVKVSADSVDMLRRLIGV